MRRNQPDPLLKLLGSFFHEHLTRVRGASRHTVSTYRDALRLLFAFLGRSTKRPVESLGLQDITAERVLEFLAYLETDRHNGASTRNARLTAVKSFSRHVIRNEPLHGAQYQRILSLPQRRVPPPLVTYLEPEEVQAMLRHVKPTDRNGVRDLALLLFLYNTGGRASEALAVRGSDLQLARPYQVQIYGKGRKQRICPLWPQTAAALRELIARNKLAPDAHVFQNAWGEPLTRDGLAYILEKYVRHAAHEQPTLRRKNVTPHSMRHGCAVGLLQAGVDIAVIRDYLGHESIATTGRYTHVNLQMKRRVMEAFWQRARLTTPKRLGPWAPSTSVLAFLNSL